MKTGNVSPGNILLKQAKTFREDKASPKKPDSCIQEKVDLASKRSSYSPNVPLAYDEVLDLLYGINYGQFKDIEWISLQGRTSLLEML
ncbi:MAG: hypothetical protein ACYDHW_02570 [Syntrophorhabdaceae bacterium]